MTERHESGTTGLLDALNARYNLTVGQTVTVNAVTHIAGLDMATTIRIAIEPCEMVFVGYRLAWIREFDGEDEGKFGPPKRALILARVKRSLFADDDLALPSDLSPKVEKPVLYS